MDRQIEEWHKIWSGRVPPDNLPITLELLLQLDGFDSNASGFSKSDWLQQFEALQKILQIKAGSRIFEVGCGSGAFLYPWQRFLNCTVGGLDYSQELINVAIKALPGGEFICSPADDLSSDQKYDYVFAFGLFHYLPLDSARNVLIRMINKAQKEVLVLDVPDLSQRTESEKRRQELIGSHSYKDLYSNTFHTYFEKSWFSDLVTALGKDLQFIPNLLPNYQNGPYRFGVRITG
jgi:cyclopropane fatty-acyl-phospholipid synthase-like methyltransferase